jgi:excisionase family DNA binding protein
MRKNRKKPVVLPFNRSELKLLTIPQTAALLEIDEDTVRDLYTAGKLKHLRLAAQSIRIRVSEIERFLQAQEVEVPAAAE